MLRYGVLLTHVLLIIFLPLHFNINKILNFVKVFILSFNLIKNGLKNIF